MIKKCLLGVMRLLPLRKAFVLESHPDLSDNTYALYEELLRRGYHKKYKLYWMKTFPESRTGICRKEFLILKTSLRDFVRRSGVHMY